MSYVRKEVLAEERYVTIYGIGGDDEVIRYVGKTARYVGQRYHDHRRAAMRRDSQYPFHRWLRKKLTANGGIYIKHLERVAPGCDWASRERYWIEHLKANGNKLLNLTDGGEGLSGHKFSDEHKAGIAKSLTTGSHFNCETCGTQFWRKLNEIKKNHNRFCSRDCYAVSRSGVAKPIPDWITRRGIEAAAIKRAKATHCKRGHAYADHAFVSAGGGRGCKECRKLHKLTYRAKGGK